MWPTLSPIALFASAPVSATQRNQLVPVAIQMDFKPGSVSLRIHPVYSCFEKSCPTEKHESVRDNTERHDGLWFVHCCIFKFTSSQRDGRRCYEYLFAYVERNKMDSKLLSKFIEYFPDYLSALSRTLLRFFWTTIVETAVYELRIFRHLILLTDQFLWLQILH